MSFSLQGLVSPATVSDSIFVYSPAVPSGYTVDYYVDGALVDSQTQAPYWLGGSQNGTPAGFSTAAMGSGTHTLLASTRNGSPQMSSNTISLNVVPSIANTFSSQLTPYANHLSAQQTPFATVLQHTTTPQAQLSSADTQVRQNVLAMYLNWGVDPSVDYTNTESQTLLNLSPKSWAPAALPSPLSSPGKLMSPDAPFYHPIPSAWPRVALPANYVQTFQLNTVQEGDGIGFGIVYSQSGDPMKNIVSQWYDQVSSRVTYSFPVPDNWQTFLPWQTAGDEHMIFVNSAAKTFISSYKTSGSGNTINALYASAPTPLNSLGDHGGSVAAAFAELPVLIRPGEATSASTPIGHAIGGPVRRTWMARVYPATGWDDGIQNSIASCTGVGYTNIGLVPYGGVIQLDPQLDLTKLGLTLPAFRILQAMQQYGYYVMDYGCEDMDIYTSISEEELNPYGGLWGYNGKGVGVQYEVAKVLEQSTLYVVAPLFKKQ